MRVWIIEVFSLCLDPFQDIRSNIRIRDLGMKIHPFLFNVALAVCYSESLEEAEDLVPILDALL